MRDLQLELEYPIVGSDTGAGPLTTRNGQLAFIRFAHPWLSAVVLEKKCGQLLLYEPCGADRVVTVPVCKGVTGHFRVRARRTVLVDLRESLSFVFVSKLGKFQLFQYRGATVGGAMSAKTEVWTLAL